VERVFFAARGQCVGVSFLRGMSSLGERLSRLQRNRILIWLRKRREYRNPSGKRKSTIRRGREKGESKTAKGDLDYRKKSSLGRKRHVTEWGKGEGRAVDRWRLAL